MDAPSKNNQIDSAQYAAALSFLYNRIDYERTSLPERSRGLKLDRMRRLLALLGDPQKQLRIVHVAGTKGKGSTAAMIAAALTASGLRTGLYTSPHLERVEERIAIDGTPVSSVEFANLVDDCRSAVAQIDQEAVLAGEPANGATFFEITTAMMFLHFARQRTDAAVLEVGLGGRLDSTNVCDPVISVITSISFDHTKQLGDTLTAIAGEKAGIIKAGVPVVSGVEGAEPARVVYDVAERMGCRLYALHRDFDFQYTAPVAAENTETTDILPSITFLEPAKTQSGKTEFAVQMDSVRLGMLGKHQATNAAIAIATLRRLVDLGWKIDDDTVRLALAKIRCPARIELIEGRPPVIIDAAHNVASVQALLNVLDESFPSRKRVLIFAVSHDKDVAGMLALLLKKFDQVLLTKFSNNTRGMPEAELAQIAARVEARLRTESRKEGISAKISDIQVFPDSHHAWHFATTHIDPGGVLCVAGSFFLAAEIRPLATTNYGFRSEKS